MKDLIQRSKIIELMKKDASKSQEVALNQFLTFCEGDFDISKFNDFKDELLDNTDMKASSISTRIYQVKGLIRKVLNKSDHLIQGQRFQIEQILKDVKAPKLQSKGVSIEKVLSDEEILILNEELTSKSNGKEMFLLLISTGIRVSELINLKYTDIDT